VIAVYRWGWVDYGTRFKPRWDETASKLEVSISSSVSEEFLSVLETDYPGYDLIPNA